MMLPRRVWRWALAACAMLAAPGPAGAQDAGNERAFRVTPYFLVLLVEAKGLDYQNRQSLLRSLHKSQLKGGYLGHSWVLLAGMEQGRRHVVEVGHSTKEADSIQFFNGVLDLSDYGFLNPTEEQKANPRREPNPVSYLWRDHGTGYLQPARDARVTPTYAAKVDLDEAQYRRIKARLDPKLPEYKSFQLTGRQCSSFVAEIAALAGVEIRHQVTIPVPSEVEFNGRRVHLWSDPKYSSITLSSPDVVEPELKRLVASGRAENALAWYLAGARMADAARNRMAMTGTVAVAETAR